MLSLKEVCSAQVYLLDILLLVLLQQLFVCLVFGVSLLLVNLGLVEELQEVVPFFVGQCSQQLLPLLIINALKMLELFLDEQNFIYLVKLCVIEVINSFFFIFKVPIRFIVIVFSQLNS